MTKFKKGQSGNPGGRPKSERALVDLARKKALQALKRLCEWVESDNPTASVAACRVILDRAYGRPAQSHDVGFSNAWDPAVEEGYRKRLEDKLLRFSGGSADDKTETESST